VPTIVGLSPTAHFDRLARPSSCRVLQALLSRGVPVDVADHNGSTPLHMASRQGHVALARALLAAGAPVDARCAGGCTALHRAAANGHAGVVRLLRAHGADMEARAGAANGSRSKRSAARMAWRVELSFGAVMQPSPVRATLNHI